MWRRKHAIRFRLATSLIAITAIAFAMAVLRCLAIGGNVMSIVVVAGYMFSGVFSACLFAAAGYGVGKRYGALFATLVFGFVWLSPMWLSFFDGQDPIAIHFAALRGPYTAFVGAVSGVLIWATWGATEEPDELEREVTHQRLLGQKRALRNAAKTAREAETED